MHIKKTGIMQKIVCSLLVLMYTQLAYTAAAAQTATYDAHKAQKELREIDKKYPVLTIGERFFKAVIYSKWHNAAEYLLAEKIVNINALEKKSTFLGMGIDASNEKVVKWLLDHDADINKRDGHGNTALICACMGGYENYTGFGDYYPIIKLLLARGAHANIKCIDGETALMKALKNPSYRGPSYWDRRTLKQIIDILLRRGADFRLENNSRQSTQLFAAVRSLDSYLIGASEAVKNRDRKYALRAHLELTSMLVMYCNLNEIELANIITDYVGDVVPPLDWEIGMPVIKQPKKESGCVIS